MFGPETPFGLQASNDRIPARPGEPGRGPMHEPALECLAFGQPDGFMLA